MTPRTCVTTPTMPSRAYTAESAGSTVRAARSEKTPAMPAATSGGVAMIGVHIHLSPKEPR
jgi:hypothetical protein